MTATDDTGTLPWHLTGNRAPTFEERTVTELEVKGAIPTELTGRYFRNGANPKVGRSEHWFLGDGMVHGIELAGGKANWYRNRYVRTPMLGRPDSDRMELYLDPETFTFNYDVSTANTHVLGHNGRIFALEEGAFPYELSKELDTIGPCDFDGRLTTAFTAHPKICPETGEMLAFAYSSLPPFLTYHRVDAAGRLVQSTEITVTGSTMMHDFAVSRHHSVFMDLPMIFDMELAMQGGMPIRWSDEYPARFGVMPREGLDADVRWFDVDPCYVFHTLNAHDEGDEVVVRGCRIKELWRSTSDIGGGDDAAAMPMMWEWRFNLKTGAVREHQLDDRNSEFPRVPDAKAGLDGRYGYAMSDTPSGGGHIFKYDFANGAERSVFDYPRGHRPGEPVFIPAEDGTAEDDGYLMTYVHAEDTDTSYLSIVDASDLTAEPVAEVHLPFRIPVGFHGSWIAD
ncbi:MAG: carotenoid oxygenase family protein [Actinomycetota bacterium]